MKAFYQTLPFTRRISVRIINLGILISVLYFSISSCTTPVKPPNIVLIIVDDLGIKDLGCYGQEYIETPKIDHFANEGMIWKNAYSSGPVCSPTRASIITGKNPARVHFTGHVTAIEEHRHPKNSTIIPPEDLMYIPYEELTIAEALKETGYVSGSFGKWHLGGPGYWPEDQGFDVNVGGWTHGSPPAYFFPYENPESSWNRSIPTLKGGEEGEYLPDRLTNEAMSFIQKNSEHPFFVYLSYYAVHTPLQAPEDLIEKYKPIVNNTGIDPIYAAMVERVDYNVGRLLRYIDEQGLKKNTVVILTSDNGGLETVTDNSPYRRGKGHLYDGGIRIPLMIRWPGVVKQGSVSQNRTISMDIYTSILDMAGVDYDTIENIDGRSLLNDFSGSTLAVQPDLHWYYPHYGIGQDPGGILIKEDHKLIIHYDPPKTELFNIKTDIGETKDISAEFPDLTETLKKEYMNWLKSVDPIMHTVNPDHQEN